MIKAGESVLLIFKFFIQQLGKVFDILSKFEILPGISYLGFLISVIIICIIIKLIRFGIDIDTYSDGRGNVVQTISKNYSFGHSSVRNKKSTRWKER